MAAKVEEAYSERTEKVNAAGEMVEVNLDGDPAKRLFFRRLAVEAGEMWHREVQKRPWQ